MTRELEMSNQREKSKSKSRMSWKNRMIIKLFKNWNVSRTGKWAIKRRKK